MYLSYRKIPAIHYICLRPQLQAHTRSNKDILFSCFNTHVKWYPDYALFSRHTQEDGLGKLLGTDFKAMLPE
jgi:hypothetical protein